MCILLYLRASRSKNISKESVKIEGRHRGRGCCRVISKANTRHKINKQNRKKKKSRKINNANLKSQKEKKSYKSAPIKSCECQGIYTIYIEYFRMEAYLSAVTFG